MFYRDANQKFFRIRLNRKQITEIDFSEILHKDDEMTIPEKYEFKRRWKEGIKTYIPN